MKRGLHEKKTLTIREHTRDRELEVKERMHQLIEDVLREFRMKKGASKKAPMKNSRD